MARITKRVYKKTIIKSSPSIKDVLETKKEDLKPSFSYYILLSYFPYPTLLNAIFHLSSWLRN